MSAAEPAPSGACEGRGRAEGGERRRRGRKKKRPDAQHAAPFSREHAAILSDLLAVWLDSAHLPPSTVVAAFVLAALSLKYGRSWAVGPAAGSGSADDDASSRGETTIGSVPGLCGAITPYPRKLLAWCGLCDREPAATLGDITLRSVFARCRLCQQKPCLHAAIVGWLDGSRPLVLMHSIPSPMQVLEMQSVGQRVCTLFLDPAEISALHTSELAYLDAKGTVHARDALEFLAHDLSHMERFWGDTFEEQVGFFAAMRGLDPTDEGRPWRFFRQFHGKGEMKELWPQLQYVFSDMNCWATHLMGYLKAKWMGFRDGDGKGGFDVGWSHFLDRIGLEGEAREAAQRMCGSGEKMTPEQGESLRDFFKSMGRRAAGKD